MSALMAKVARIDVDQVYWGLGAPVPLDQVKAGDFVFGDAAITKALPAGAVYIDADCDLPGGKYRFAQATLPGAPLIIWRLEPLPAAAVKAEPADITPERALYEQLRRTHEHDAKLVAAVALAWAKQYETTWDADNGSLLTYFRELDKPAAPAAVIAAGAGLPS